MDNTKKKKDVRKAADSDENSNSPLKVFRQDAVAVSVFARTALVKGQPRTFHSASFSRSYRDANGNWQYSKNFDSQDLGKVMALAKQASEFIDAEGGLVAATVED